LVFVPVLFSSPQNWVLYLLLQLTTYNSLLFCCRCVDEKFSIKSCLDRRINVILKISHTTVTPQTSLICLYFNTITSDNPYFHRSVIRTCFDYTTGLEQLRIYLFYIFTLSLVFIVCIHIHALIHCVKRALKGRADRARDKSIKTHFSRLILPLYAWDHRIYYIIYDTAASHRQPFSSHVFPKMLRHFTCTFFSCIYILHTVSCRIECLLLTTPWHHMCVYVIFFRLNVHTKIHV
jgi:hypothetical protein